MPAHPEAIALAVDVASAADDKLASNLALYDVADVLAVVDVFALCSGGSDRQVRAIVDSIEERLRTAHDLQPIRREGSPESGWVLLDYGDVVAHVFTTEQRGFYDLDRLFSDVTSFDPRSGEVARESTRRSDADPSPALDAQDLAAATTPPLVPDQHHDGASTDARAVSAESAGSAGSTGATGATGDEA